MKEISLNFLLSLLANIGKIHRALYTYMYNTEAHST